MTKRIKGIHHVSLNATKDNYQTAIDFYTRVLGLEIYRSWPAGTMIDTGAGIIEIFNHADNIPEQGAVRHFALEVTDVDAIVDTVTKEGYEVFKGPEDVTIPSIPPFPLRMAFIHGPLNEEIEFFEVK